METINLTPVSMENMPIEKFMRLKREGKLSGFRVRGIVPPSLGKGRDLSGFGAIEVERLNPIYKAL
jgi:hypothetical protein